MLVIYEHCSSYIFGAALIGMGAMRKASLMSLRLLLLCALCVQSSVASATGIGPPEGMLDLLIIAFGFLVFSGAILLLVPMYYRKHRNKSIFLIWPIWIGAVVFLSFTFLGVSF